MERDEDKLATLDRHNDLIIGRISNALQNLPLEREATTLIRRCEDCDTPLAKDYDGDICWSCALREVNPGT